jgi:hypothetical protein
MRSERFAAATGAAYVLAMFIGSGLAQSGAGGADDGPSVLADLQRGRSGANAAGTALEVLGVGLLVVFLGYLYRVLRRAEGPDGWWAAPAFGAGLVSVAVKLGSAAPFLAAHLRSKELTPDLARTLNDINGAGFVISGYTWGIFVLAAAAAAFCGRVVPRWLAVIGLVVGVLSVAAGTAGVLDPKGYVAIPFLLGLVWVFVISVLLTVRASRPAGDRSSRGTADAVPAGASRTA